MRARRAEREPERLDDGGELVPALGDQPRHVGEAVDPTRLDLHLGGDQLAGEVRLGRGAARRLPHVLEPVDEVEARGVEQSELLLHRDRQIVRRLEALARLPQQLVVAHLLLFTHGAKRVVDTAPDEAGRANPIGRAAALRVALDPC